MFTLKSLLFRRLGIREFYLSVIGTLLKSLLTPLVYNLQMSTLKQ